MMNIYNGNIQTDESEEAVVYLPDYFDALNIEFRYQLPAIGVMVQAIVLKKIENNLFLVKMNDPNVDVKA